VTQLETLVGILILIVIYIAVKAIDKRAARMSATDALTVAENGSAEVTPVPAGSDGAS
jgi:hypothetical protein